MWDLPGAGLEPVSPALAGGFLTTAPPGKPCRHFQWTARKSSQSLKCNWKPWASDELPDLLYCTLLLVNWEKKSKGSKNKEEEKEAWRAEKDMKSRARLRGPNSPSSFTRDAGQGSKTYSKEVLISIVDNASSISFLLNDIPWLGKPINIRFCLMLFLLQLP